MATPDRDRPTDRLSSLDSRSAGPSGVRSRPAPTAAPARASAASGADRTSPRRGRRTRWPEKPPSRAGFRPQVGLLEQRSLLSALPTLTAPRASTVSPVSGQSVTFTATVSALSAGEAPSGERSLSQG